MTPKRRWYQIHLSTAIFAMFAAGTMLYLNTGDMVVKHTKEHAFRGKDEVIIVFDYLGWPLSYEGGISVPIDLFAPGVDATDEQTAQRELNTKVSFGWSLKWAGRYGKSWYLLSNFLICVLLLVSLVMALEFFMWRYVLRRQPDWLRAWWEKSVDKDGITVLSPEREMVRILVELAPQWPRSTDQWIILGHCLNTRSFVLSRASGGEQLSVKFTLPEAAEVVSRVVAGPAWQKSDQDVYFRDWHERVIGVNQDGNLDRESKVMASWIKTHPRIHSIE